MKQKPLNSFEDLGKLLGVEPSVEEREPEHPLKFIEHIKSPKIYTEKRKNGKMVTLVKNLNCSQEQLSLLIKKIKKDLGIGGQVQDNHLILQGSLQDKIRTFITDFKA